MSPLDIKFDAPSEELLPQPATLKELQNFYDGLLFHGTGRLAYGFDDGDKSKPAGTLVDVLRAVANEGLKPQADHIARLFLPVERTVSLTQQRVYARCYAEMFGADSEGKTHLQYTFGKTNEWKKYFFDISARAMKNPKNVNYIFSGIRYFFTRFNREEREKVRDVQHHQQRWYANKALVKDNHPMIFGVDQDTVSTVKLPHGLDFFETRTGEIIDPKVLKLLEVPLAQVNSVREEITRLSLDNMRVVPMELGEVLSFLRGVEKCSLAYLIRM